MTITFVTAFYAPSSTVTFRSTEFYFSMFDYLASTGLPILLFLDEILSKQGENISVQYPNVKIEYTTLNKSWLPDDDFVLPKDRNPIKDTVDYFHIQLSKLRHLSRASEMVDTTHLAWIDFGIFHVMKDKEYAKNILQQIYEMNLPLNTIFSPGCWQQTDKNFVSDRVVWYHCGGFMTGDRLLFNELYVKQDDIVRHHLPLLAWEVNYWATMDDFTIYRADHNETMLSELLQFAL